MSYINFKGIDSRTVPGLLICELPPITKPQMRTIVTEIEGRDGDIVDEIGYSSYDKTINIGLTRNYDINQIIKYFSGSGDLIMSNEADKVYKASIYSQIDYDRLLRFRTANIKFHVQPFKYKANEAKIYKTITNQEPIEIVNRGLEKSKPILTIYGTGIITIAINGYDVFAVDLGEEEEYVVVDSLKEDAYKGSILKNRLMSGDFPVFDVGVNTITWTGNLTGIIVEPKSRWL